MVDIDRRSQLSSPPDRRLLSQLTNDPKLIRYLENLWADSTQVVPENLGILLELIINAAEVAQAAQSTANASAQSLAGISNELLSLAAPSTELNKLAQDIAERAAQVQPSDQEIQRLQRKVDELENQLLDIRPPVYPAQTPAFSPSSVTITSSYAVIAAPAYQPLTVRANATTSGFTVTLPAAPALMQLLNVKKIDATANAVTISGGAINIDGAPTVAIGTQYTNLQVQFNGTTWDVL